MCTYYHLYFEKKQLTILKIIKIDQEGLSCLY